MVPSLKRGKRSFFTIAVIDTLLLVIAFHLGILLTGLFGDGIQPLRLAWTSGHGGQLLCFVSASLLGMFALGLYNPRLREPVRGVVRRLTLGLTISFVLISLMLLVYPAWGMNPFKSIPAFVTATLLLASFRVVLPRVRDLEMFRTRILVLGAGNRAAVIEQRMRRRVDRQNFTIIGYLPTPGDAADPIPRNLQIARTGRLLDLVDRYDADEIVVACDERRNNLPLYELLECKLRGVEITDLLEFIERETGQIAVDLVYPSWMIYSTGFRPADNVRTQLDWLFNFSIAAVLFLLVWPLMLGTALAIYLEDGRRGAPLFYRQTRVGLHGKNFKILKFRSMRVDAEKHGAQWAQANDDRITRVGHVIRKYRLDELPQILNVLRGDMGFVGPRPERPEFVEKLQEKLPFYAERHAVKPGLTGWAQLCYPYGATEDDALEKLKFDLYYIKHRSFLLDLFIFVQTAEVVLLKKGAR